MSWTAVNEHPEDLEVITGGDWKSKVAPRLEEILWLNALDGDVQSAQIEFKGYAAAAARMPDCQGEALAVCNAIALHHAKAFVCAIRRIWALLETAELSGFTPEVARVIKLERKKKRVPLERYVEPRNAIEHVSAEVKSPQRHILQNQVAIIPATGTWHPILALVDVRASAVVLADDRNAPVNRTALRCVLQIRERIVEAVMKHCQPRSSQLLMLGPLDVEGWME